MIKIKLVIFDKDGTLINHEQLFSNWLINQVDNFGELINKVELYNKLGFNYNDKKTFNSESIVARGTNDEIRNCLYNYIINNTKLNKDTIELIKDKWIDLEINYDNLIECGEIQKSF